MISPLVVFTSAVVVADISGIAATVGLRVIACGSGVGLVLVSAEVTTGVVERAESPAGVMLGFVV